VKHRRRSGGIGSVRETVKNDGTVNSRVDFDPFGNMISIIDPSSGGAATTLKTRLNFTGQEYDADLRLVWYSDGTGTGRWYDPATGTFINQDALRFAAGDANLYRYVGNGATYAVDPSGELIQILGGAVVGGAIGGTVSWWNGGSFWGGAATGAVAGAVGAATFGAGIVVFGGGLGTGAAVTGFASGALGGIAGGATSSILNQWGNPVGINWDDVSTDACIGGVIGGGFGTGWGRGREIGLPGGGRIAPFGNRTGHRYGRWPHYHRRIPDPQAPGNSLPGQGIGRHRPWEPKSTDQCWRDRF
jgi:RHS repeat-associated protein